MIVCTDSADFLRSLRRILFLDASHCSGVCGGIFMSIVGIDANNHIVFLFGAHFADNESARVWVAGLGFFETKVLSKVADLTFVLVADGDKGIAAAVAGIRQLELFNDEVHMTKHLAKLKLDVKHYLDALEARTQLRPYVVRAPRFGDEWRCAFGPKDMPQAHQDKAVAKAKEMATKEMVKAGTAWAWKVVDNG